MSREGQRDSLSSWLCLLGNRVDPWHHMILLLGTTPSTEPEVNVEY